MTGHDSEWSNRKQAEIEALRKAAYLGIPDPRETIEGRAKGLSASSKPVLSANVVPIVRQPAPEEGK